MDVDELLDTNLKYRATLIDMAGSNIAHGGASLENIPTALHKILEKGIWKEFINKMGRHLTYDRLEDFIRARPLDGLNTTPEFLRKLVRDDDVTLRMLEEELQRSPGGDQKSEAARAKINRNNVTVDYPNGNEKRKAIRRLGKDRPDLLERVEAGEMSHHAAMLEAGFRRREMSMPIEDMPRLAAALRKHLDASQLEALMRLLKSEEGI